MLSVLLYHSFPEWLPGGFAGVDVFFVISGFLITGIIWREFLEGNFSLSNFYARRVRRIFPALIAVLITCLVFGWFVLFETEYKQLGDHSMRASVFLINFQLWKESGYFDVQSELKPLLHLWSLSIEEQYYVFFPLLMLIFFKYFRAYILSFFVIFFFLSIILADWGSKNFVSFNFYSIHSRIWEFIAGSLIAYLKINLKTKKNSILNSILVSIGLLFIGYSVLFFNEKVIQHPSLLTLIPIAGTCLFLWFSNQHELITKILSFKLLVGIGLISYSLYLWHYPILAFARISDFFYENEFD